MVSVLRRLGHGERHRLETAARGGKSMPRLLACINLLGEPSPADVLAFAVEAPFYRKAGNLLSFTLSERTLYSRPDRTRSATRALRGSVPGQRPCRAAPHRA